MSDERAIAPVSSDDRIRRANSPAGSSASRAGRSGTRNWLDAAAWKESAYLAEPVKRESPTRTLGEATNATATDDSLEFVSTQRDEAPLDFSMKKRKSTSGVETRISTSPPREDDLSPADASSATYGLMKAFLERRASSPDRRLDADAESVPTGSSPFCLPNRRGPSNLFYGPTGAFPLSLAAAAAAAAVVNANSQPQNVGVSADRRHYLTQQLLQRHDHHNQSAEEFGSDNNGDRAQSRSADNPPPSAGPDCQIPALGACTPATPPAFYPGGIPGIHSPHNGHQHSSALQNRNSQQQQKIQRPFKAYNPMDPMSALQVGASLAPSALPFLNAALAPSTVGGSAPSPHLLLPNALTSPATSTSNALPPLLNAQLLSQYRQYLINAQAAAAVAALRAKSTHHLQQQIQQSPQRQSQRQQSQQLHDTMTTPIGAQIGASSQSPPQVTSTSHPHTAESSSSASSTGSPPSPNRLANPNPPASSISAISTASSSNRIRNPNLQQTQSGNGTDRRISSASGSGGSSFNDVDEDDEELLHEDDDGISNRTSPTPSCASSTALRRTSILGNGDGAGVCVGNGGERNGSNGTSKGEHGSNGASARRKGRSLPDSLKDDAYWERRRKNNEAAKRSRDARRAKEDEIAIRAALLEQENMRLRIEVAALKAETDKLRQMLLNT